jgi:transglutaminase-like putative cysteine protease
VGPDELTGDANFPTHTRLETYMPDKDGSGPHWYAFDPNLGTNPTRYDCDFGLGSTDGVDYSHTGAWSYSAMTARSGFGRFTTDISYSLIDL